MLKDRLRLYAKYSKLEWKWINWTKKGFKERKVFIKITESLKIIIPEFEKEYEEFKKLKHSRHCSMSRYRKYLKGMMDSYEKLFWCTFTFADPIPENHKKLIKEYLKEVCWDYLCNEDHGEENNRLHYHAICAFKDGKCSKNWKHGYTKIKNIRINESSETRLKLYANKLSNHATKSSSSAWFHPRGAKFVEKINFFEKTT